MRKEVNSVPDPMSSCCGRVAVKLKNAYSEITKLKNELKFLKTTVKRVRDITDHAVQPPFPELSPIKNVGHPFRTSSPVDQETPPVPGCKDIENALHNSDETCFDEYLGGTSSQLNPLENQDNKKNISPSISDNNDIQEVLDDSDETWFEGSLKTEDLNHHSLDSSDEIGKDTSKQISKHVEVLQPAYPADSRDELLQVMKSTNEKKTPIVQNQDKTAKIKPILETSFDRCPTWIKPETKFAYKHAPVRGKKRKLLPGHSCKDCLPAYKALGFNTQDTDKIINRVSRHRFYHKPTETPKGYWNLY